MEVRLFNIDTVSGLLTPDQRLQIATGEAFLSWGAPLQEEDYQTTFVGKVNFTVCGSHFLKMEIYVNTPKPDRLPTWNRALSLDPELVWERTN